jgi:hypothetical protein
MLPPPRVIALPQLAGGDGVRSVARAPNIDVPRDRECGSRSRGRREEFGREDEPSEAFASEAATASESADIRT